MNHLTVAPLKNVSAFSELVDRVMNRPPHLPGMATFHGYSGYGKSWAAIYAANKYNAIAIEVGESWSRVKFCDALMHELGLQPRGTIAQKVDKIVETLMLTNAPLIIDEFDYVVQKKFVELVREIHDNSGAPIILIGEELLPDKLAEWERFHNRVLDWIPAQPADLDDVCHLARLYAPKVEIGAPLLQHILKISQGRVRRICVNLGHIYEYARTEGLPAVDMAHAPSLRLSTGKPPQRRAA